MFKQFGASASKADKARYSLSPQWNGKAFENFSTTTMDVNLKTIPGLIRENWNGRKNRNAKTNLPIAPFSPHQFEKDNTPKFVWYGHSVLLLQIGNKNLLIDPMLGPDASPIGPIRTKRFSENSLNVINPLPPIDAVLLTHDHYDHLDLTSIEKLKSKVTTWFVALGVARHLVTWGIPANHITEFDWWQEHQFDTVKLTFTPSRHFSGRGLFDRATSLWGGWVITSEQHNIYWSGDSGYDTHFKEIGEKLGPFDWGFMECGQYNTRWHAIHMYPEESVQAAIDAGVKRAIPVHWGAFTLALHHWTEPAERFTQHAQNENLPYLTPLLGEVVPMHNTTSHSAWWKQYV